MNKVKNIAKEIKKESARKSAAVKKSVVLKPHHAKPYRKRYYLGLAVIVLLMSYLGISIIRYSAAESAYKKSVRDFVAQLFNVRESSKKELGTIRSSYGFSFKFNAEILYAGGIDDASGKVFLNDELSEERAYSVLKVARFGKGGDEGSAIGSYGIEIDYKKDYSGGQELEDMQTAIMSESTRDLSKQSSGVESFGGMDFLKTTWEGSADIGIKGADLKIKRVSYIGSLNGKPLVFSLVVNSGGTLEKDLSDLMSSIEKKGATSAQPDSDVVSPEVADVSPNSGRSLLDVVMLSGEASAANASANGIDSEKISSLYSPATVKIYNLYCMDIYFKGSKVLPDSCQASSGSGFFISGEGHIGTNGHVASNSPKDIVISYAFDSYKKGDSVPLTALIQETDLTESDFRGSAGRDDNVAFNLVIEALYRLDDSIFEAKNRVDNLIVCLNSDKPDIDELISLTKNRKEFKSTDSIKLAKFVDDDYRAVDGYGGKWFASDVAIIKIDGGNYPSVKMGDISSATQGGDLSILGYPGAADRNGLVSSDSVKPTLTSGKVSSVKNASGSDSKLIETDTTIGHGNSGGPAFNDAGEVVGIATYTIDGSGEGNGVYNYVRDIQDLKDLASKASVNTNNVSKTQSEWMAGIDLFYQSKYSKAIKHFNNVKSSYPQHPRAEEMIAAAQKKIQNGEEVKDFPIYLVVIGVVLLLGLIILVLLIIRHHKKHKIYSAQVVAGNVQPMNPTSAPVAVTYSGQEVKNYSAPAFGRAPEGGNDTGQSSANPNPSSQINPSVSNNPSSGEPQNPQSGNQALS
jgi:S1-C subfamily serine protease